MNVKKVLIATGGITYTASPYSFDAIIFNNSGAKIINIKITNNITKHNILVTFLISFVFLSSNLPYIHGVIDAFIACIIILINIAILYATL